MFQKRFGLSKRFPPESLTRIGEHFSSAVGVQSRCFSRCKIEFYFHFEHFLWEFAAVKWRLIVH